MKKHFFVDDKESLLGKAVGSSVLMKVDMGAKALSYSINGNEFIEAGIALPEGGVRPWCFLYHEGDSVTIEEVMPTYTCQPATHPAHRRPACNHPICRPVPPRDGHPPIWRRGSHWLRPFAAR
jgi:hypothetical protein